MKCDELKAIHQGSVELGDYYVYDAEDVDAAIEELKDEIYNQKWRGDEWAKAANDKDEQIDELKVDNRRLKRALWLARAERAASWQIHFSLCHNHSIEREFSINGASMPCERMVVMRTARDWAMIWKKVERKCRAKAEQYK